MSKRNSVFGSFGYAFNGIREAFRSEPNFKIHLIVGIATVVIALFFRFTFIRLALLILTITLVVILELINTAIEKIIDKISPNYSRLAKVVKDVSAGAVLLAACAAVVVGLLLFAPYILQFLGALVR